MNRIEAHTILDLLLWMAVAGIPRSNIPNNVTVNRKILQDELSPLEIRHSDAFTLLQTVCNNLLNNPAQRLSMTRKTVALVHSMIVTLTGATVRPEPKFKSTHFTHQCVLAESLGALLATWRRLDVAVLIHQSTGLRPKGVIRFLKRHSVRAEVHDIDLLSDLEVTLNTILANHRCIVVACNVKWNGQIWELAKGLEGFHRVQSWIFIQEQLSPQTLLQSPKPPNSQVTIMVPELAEVTQGTWIFNTETTPGAENSRTTNVNLGVAEDCQRLFRKNLTLTIQYDIQDGGDDGLVNCSKVTIYDAFFSSLTNQTEVLPVGEWTCGNGFCGIRFYFRVEKMDPVGRLRGRTFKIPTFEDPPFVFVDNSSNPPIITGYLKEVFDELVKLLNFRPQITVLNQNVFGTQSMNGTYTGVVGILHRREADIAMNVLGMTERRFKVVRYTPPVYRTDMSIFFKTPEMESSFLAYFKPFEPRIWTAIAITVVLALCALVTIWECRHPRDHPGHRYEAHSRARWLLTGLFLDEVLTTSTRLASKVVLGTCLMATVMLFTPYTSTFTSFLAHKTLKVPFHTLEDVGSNQDYMIVLIDGSNYYDIIMNAKGGTLSEIWRRVQQRQFQDIVKDVPDGLKKLYCGKYVFLGTGPKTKYLLRNCSVMWVKKSYFKDFNKVAIRPDFPYYDLFSFTLLKLSENGLLDRWHSRYLPVRATTCITKHYSVSLGLDNVAFSFLILGIGVGSACIALAIEIITTRDFPRPIPVHRNYVT